MAHNLDRHQMFGTLAAALAAAPAFTTTSSADAAQPHSRRQQDNGIDSTAAMRRMCRQIHEDAAEYLSLDFQEPDMAGILRRYRADCGSDDDRTAILGFCTSFLVSVLIEGLGVKANEERAIRRIVLASLARSEEDQQRQLQRHAEKQQAA